VRSFKFGDCVADIYSIETETKDATDTAISASHLNLHLEIDSDKKKEFVSIFPL
jgi:hypothetical protein